MNKLLSISISLMLLCYPIVVNGSARFKINAERQVLVTRSSSPGTKMVRVVAYGPTTEKAIEQAMCDAVAEVLFLGAKGEGEMESVPPILKNGQAQYQTHQKEFKNFFKKAYLNYVSRVNSTFPSGEDNIRTSKGRKVQVYLLVDWASLEQYFRERGFQTSIEALMDFK